MDMEFEKLMTETKQDTWRQLLEVPPDYKYAPGFKHVKNYEYDSFKAELYLQNNGPGTVQRVLITMPKEFSATARTVVFSHTEGMKPGDLIQVPIERAGRVTLFGPGLVGADEEL